MVRNEKKVRASSIVIGFFYIFLFTILSYFLFSFKDHLNMANNINYDYNQILNNNKNILKNLKTEEVTLNEKIDSLINISNNTENIKTEVFELASQLEKKIKNGESDHKIAYLTFDDGPYHLTNSFLDVLDKYKIKATFFTIGFDKDKCFDDRSKDCSSMYKKITNKGHTIANHTYSHSISGGLYSSVNSFIDDLKYQENLIKNKTGITTNIMRFPGGSAQSRNLKNGIVSKLKELNYGWVDWTAMNGDGKYVPNEQTAFNNFKSSINENIEVVLFHDYNYITLAMLPEAIEYLQKNNYILLPLFYDSVMVNK